MANIELTDQEVEFLKELIKRTRTQVQNEEATILDGMSPQFLGAEQKYDDLLKALIEKL